MEETSPEAAEENESSGETNSEIYEFGELCVSEEKKKKETENPLAAQSENIPVRIESIETEIEFKQSNRSADFIRGDEEDDKTGRYIRQGQLLHNVFASIRQESDLPQAIERLRFEGILESAEQEQQIISWPNGHWETPK